MVRLSIPAQFAYRDLALSAVLTAIEAEDDPQAGARRLPDAVRDEIVSALNEAFNNVVLHAYQGVRGGRIDLSASARSGEAEIQIHDRGKSFDPATVPGYAGAADEMDFMELPENGMGLFIIRSFMDDVTYTPGGGGRPNVLVLRKRWPATVGPPRDAGAAAVDRDERALRPWPVEADLGAADRDERALRPRSLGPSAPEKESAQSGWRMRSVAVTSQVELEASGRDDRALPPKPEDLNRRTAGSLKRK